jgi:hypothetical protein
MDHLDQLIHKIINNHHHNNQNNNNNKLHQIIIFENYYINKTRDVSYKFISIE